MTNIYEHQKNYEQIKDFVQKGLSGADLLKYILINKISYDCYVPFRSGFIPLFYYITTLRDNLKLVVYFISKKIQLRDPDGPYSLAAICKKEYLEVLEREGFLGSVDEDSIFELLVNGDHNRIKWLLEKGFVKPDHLRNSAGRPDALSKIISKFIEKVGSFFGADTWGTTTEYLVYRYAETIKLVANELEVNKHTYRILVCFYLHQFIHILGCAGAFPNIPEYHRFMDEKIVAKLRPLLNDYNYVTTCKLLKCKVDDIAYGWGYAI
jgi:hypothetical protein